MATEKATAKTIEEAPTLQQRLRGQLEQARERVGERITMARERLGEVQERASDLFGDAVAYVRANPGKVVAAAVGIGIAVGLLLRLRSAQEISEYE